MQLNYLHFILYRQHDDENFISVMLVKDLGDCACEQMYDVVNHVVPV